MTQSIFLNFSVKEMIRLDLFNVGNVKYMASLRCTRRAKPNGTCWSKLGHVLVYCMQVQGNLGVS